MDEPDMDLLVLQYLKRKGYSGTAAALQRDSKLGDSVDVDQNNQGTLESLVHIAEVEGSADRYPSGYQQLWAWVDGTLEMYRGELKRILYPVFIYSYIELVKQSKQQLAAELMNRHKKRLVETAPAGSGQHRDMELRELQGLAVPQHLESNPRAKALRSRRPTLKLCASSYHLLINFLQTNHLWHVLNIINQNLNVEVYDGEPLGEDDRGASQDAEEAEEDVSGDPAVSEANRTSVTLQLLQGNLEDKLWELQHPDGGEEKGEAGGEAGSKSKKQKSDDKNRQKQRQQHKQEVEGRMESKVTLPVLSEEQVAAALADMRRRQDVGPSTPPSCCFFTFCNTHQTLTSSAHAADASLLAGGFSDASIRLFSAEHLTSPKDPPSGSGRDGSPSEPMDDGRRRWREQITLRGHSAAVNAVEFSSDSRLLISGATDGTVRLWSTELGANLVVWRGHVLPVWDVSSCPSGYLLASASADRTAHLWCTEHLGPQRIFVGHEADVDVVRWHPNCHYIATGSTDKTVRMWDIQTGTCVRVLQGHGAPLTALAFSPDGSSLASAAADGAIMIWDLGSARRSATLLAHDGAVWTLAYSHGRGGILASGGADCCVKFWSSHSGDGSASDGPDRAGAAARGAEASWDLLDSYRTKSTPVYSLQFTTRNLLLGSGALTLRSKQRH